MRGAAERGRSGLKKAAQAPPGLNSWVDRRLLLQAGLDVDRDLHVGTDDLGKRAHPEVRPLDRRGTLPAGKHRAARARAEAEGLDLEDDLLGDALDREVAR